MSVVQIFLASEVAVMVGLVSKIDPDSVTRPEVKAIILKCKATMTDKTDRIRVIEG